MTSWIQHFKTYFIAMLIAFTSYSIAFAQSNCGLFEKKITFKDGSIACMKELPFLNIPGLMTSIPRETYTTQAGYKSTYAIATTDNPQMCPFTQSMQWDNGDDSYRAVQRCEERLKDEVSKLGKSDPNITCKCSVLIDNGKSNLSQNDFKDRTSLYQKQLNNGNKSIAQIEQQGKSQTTVVANSPSSNIDQTALNQINSKEIEAQKRKAEQLKQEEAKVLAEKIALETRKAELAAIENQRLAELKKNEDEVQRKKEEDQRLLSLKLAEAEKIKQKAEEERLQLLKLNLEAQKIQEQKILELKLAEQKRLEAERIESDRKIAMLQKEMEANRLAQEMKIKEEEEKAKLVAQEAQKQKLAQLSNRYALVIGNNAYKEVNKLDNAVQDAKDMAIALQQIGFKVTLKTDLNEKEMKATFRNFKSVVGGGDEVFFFYAGHGLQIGSTNFLLPVDAAGENEDQIKDDAMPMQRILDDMSDKKVKLTVAVIDACRDNPFKTLTRKAVGGRGLAPTDVVTGQMIIYSAGTGQTALDKLGPNDKNKNGLFTRVFLKEMVKPGVSLDKLLRNVRNEVVTLARSVNQEQVPAIYDQVVGDFYLIPN